MCEQSRDQQGKDFVNRREEDNYTIKLREQESEKMKKKERRGSMLWQDMLKRRGATTTRLYSRRDFTYVCEVFFREDNRGVELEICTNLNDLRAFV